MIEAVLSRPEVLPLVRDMVQDVCLVVGLVGVAWAFAWAVVKLN